MSSRDSIDRLSTHAVLAEILKERGRQDDKWGEQNHDPFLWMAILAEEVGELAQAVLQAKFGGKTLADARKEAIQVAAVAVAIIECLDRGKWRWPPDLGAVGKEHK